MRKMIVVILAVVVVLLQAGQTAAQLAQIETPAGASAKVQKLITRANAQLFKVCSGLWTYWPDIKQAEVAVNILTPDLRAYDFRWEEYGWGGYLEYTITITDKPKGLPNTAFVIRNLLGHRLFYSLGGGRQPGILARKAGAQALCGLEPNEEGRDILIPVPDLAFLDGLAAR